MDVFLKQLELHHGKFGGINKPLVADTMTEVGTDEKEYIQSCMKEIQSKSCLAWKEMNENSKTIKYWVNIIRAEEPTGCSTTATAQPKVTLAPHCFQDGWVLHELLHALGFDHEHQRIDRDCYVEVHADKWSDPAYKILKPASVTFPYDIHSVMHYRRGSFMRPAFDFPDQDAEFGSKDVLSKMDEWKLNYGFCKGPHYCDKNKEECDEVKKHNERKKCIH